MKSFTFEIKVPEGHDEFWESLDNMTVETAAAAVQELVEESFRDYGIDGVECNFKQLTWDKK